MNKHILLGIDAPISPATKQALRSIGNFVEQNAPLLHLVLLHVIPVPSDRKSTRLNSSHRL